MHYSLYEIGSFALGGLQPNKPLVFRSRPLPQALYNSMYLGVFEVPHCDKQNDVIQAYVSKACVSSKWVCLRHQAYILYKRNVCILVFLHMSACSVLLRRMLESKRLACGSDDVTQYNTITTTKLLEFHMHYICP